MLFTNLTGLHGYRFDSVTDKKTRPFVKADDGTLRIVRLGIQPENPFHCGQKSGSHFADYPLLFQVGLEFVFLRMRPISVWEMVSMYSSSTTFSAKRRRLHWLCPSGASLQAKAVIWARVIPSISWGRPERGLSVKNSSPFSPYFWAQVDAVCMVTPTI